MKRSSSYSCIEEQAIETGYSHTEEFSAAMATALNRLTDAVVQVTTDSTINGLEVSKPPRVRSFTRRRRQAYLARLNARQSQDESAFDAETNLRAIRSLERLARQYKQGDDLQSLREIARLLIAASGHDLHEVRNRANLALERVLAPKEFDAPLATSFVNLRRGATHHFAFDLPQGKAIYFVRLYRCSSAALPLEHDLRFIDLDLHYETTAGVFVADYRFADLGHYDYHDLAGYQAFWGLAEVKPASSPPGLAHTSDRRQRAAALGRAGSGRRLGSRCGTVARG